MSQGKQGVETSGGATVDGLVGCSRVEAQREHVRRLEMARHAGGVVAELSRSRGPNAWVADESIILP